MAKCTGIVRRIDDLGRVVIPKEIRRTMKIREGDPLIISTTENGVLFEKYDIGADITDSLKTVIDNFEGDLTKNEIEDIRKIIKSVYLRTKGELPREPYIDNE
jgi:stage V sporulation protein T